jgi:hypothetical protein
MLGSVPMRRDSFPRVLPPATRIICRRRSSITVHNGPLRLRPYTARMKHTSCPHGMLDQHGLLTV